MQTAADLPIGCRNQDWSVISVDCDGTQGSGAFAWPLEAAASCVSAMTTACCCAVLGLGRTDTDPITWTHLAHSIDSISQPIPFNRNPLVSPQAERRPPGRCRSSTQHQAAVAQSQSHVQHEQQQQQSTTRRPPAGAPRGAGVHGDDRAVLRRPCSPPLVGSASMDRSIDQSILACC